MCYSSVTLWWPGILLNAANEGSKREHNEGYRGR